MHYSFSTRRNQGFSLVEIMVGVAIGLLGVLIIMQVSVVFEGQKRTTTTGSDAQTNGVTALYTVERDVRRAGYGLSVPGALDCKVKRYYDTAATSDLSLAPVVITDGASGAPDSIRILSSSKTGWSLPSRITVEHPATATNIFLNTTLGMEEGDLLVAYEGKDCTLMQATGIPNGNVQVHHQNTSKWNPPGGANIFPAGGYSVGAQILNLGALIDHTYSLDNKSSDLMLDEYNSTDNLSTKRAVTADIVNMQAEYGFDTRPDPRNDPRVDTWSATMINADGGDTNGDGDATNDAGDIARVIAVRMAVVARSPLMEKPNASGVCDITQNPPTWTDKNIQIDVSKNPDGTANANWKCYRYKTFENTIPLRNVLWGRT